MSVSFIAELSPVYCCLVWPPDGATCISCKFGHNGGDLGNFITLIQKTFKKKYSDNLKIKMTHLGLVFLIF